MPEWDDRLRFHVRCGTLVKLSSNSRSAKRLRAFDEFNNGVVMTNRNLFDDELFEIRIDKLVDKWSGSVEVGVTIHDPGAIPIPSTMTNLRTGTSMMSGRGILANGKGIRREYGNFNLDDLKVGDRIGLIRKRNGDLHYYINGLDQGVAVSNLPSKVWGVVDMYGRTVKVTIVDRDVNEERNLLTRLSNSITLSNEKQLVNEDLLEFHPMCGAHTLVINNNTVAYRPNALDDFNNGVVLTNRPLRLNELFEVRLDRLVTKWAGSIEIGVTTHSPGDIDYPLTMTNVHSGTWMMTGVGIMHNGITVVNQYGVNLDTLRVGDRVGAIVKSNGSLYFYVNGIDQGEAAKNIPIGVYGVVDLYGQAAQITLCRDNVDQISPYKNNVRFFPNHGKNARIVPGSRGRTADRLYSEYEFSQSIVLVNQMLQDGELFSVSVDKLNDRWSGSIEVGVTTILPNILSADLPNTMTDLDHDTWVLSGCTVMKDGLAIKYNYSLDLDKVKIGSVVGVMRHSNGCLNYFLDGNDQGVACTNVPPNLYPVIDIYGRCTQVTIQSPPEIRCDDSDSDTSCCSQDDAMSVQTETGVKGQKDINLLQFLYGENIKLIEDYRTATRVKSFKGGLLICDNKMQPNELFQILIVKCNTNYAGSMRIGVVSSLPETPLPSNIRDLSMKEDVWYFSGNQVWYNQSLIMNNYCPSLDRLREGDRVGIKYTVDRTLHLFVNGYDQGIAVYNAPEVIYGVIDLYGCHISAKVIQTDQDSKTNVQMISSQCNSEHTSDISESVKVDTTINVLKRMTVLDEDMSECCSSEISYFIDESTFKLMKFNDWRGRNIRLSRDGRTATRIESYNHGLTMTPDILLPNSIFQVEIQALNKKWESSLMIGVSKITCTNNSAPPTALSLKGYDSTWIISGDSVYFDGLKIKSNYGPDLNYCVPGDIIGIMIDGENRLKLFVNRIDFGVAAFNIPADCYGIVDLYGQCEQVSIVNPFIDMSPVDPVPNMPMECDVLPEDASQPIPSEEKADFEGDEKQSPACEETELADLTWMKTDKTNENVLVASGHDVRSRSAELAGWIDDEASTSTLRMSTIRVGKTSGYYTPDTRERRQNEILKSLRLKQCQYFNLSSKIRAYLSIPDVFFLEKGHTCYCEGCNLYTCDENKLSIEMGWCKFLLRKHPKFNNLPLDKWRSAYVGRSFDMIRNCLDNGTLTVLDTEPEDIILYPYLKRTVCCQNIKPFGYYDLETNNQYKCHAAFELMIEQGSFEVGEFLPGSSRADCHQISSLVIPKNGTKTVLTALYFRFDRDLN
ncbi:neuralized-like protein 4 isoform X1 [Aphis craccivora]|uniref:Neuralized-like protein 4 isoform X1 n=1 Tax=Aphis craccivora TaxID=307492 RepID=A0A6G0Z6Y4_APHCR|nr:neuralized-like protein 4 isoform X1 [Aphis craccivora]